MASQITLITGCSSGLGLLLAVKLAQDQNKSYLVYATLRNLGKKGELEQAAGSALNDTLFIRELDVTKDDSVKSIYNDLMEKHGRVDILVNNAGVGYYGPLDAMSMEKAKRMFDTNFFGIVRNLHEVIPIMKKQKSGRIVNVSSVLGTTGMPFTDMYNASKWAIEGLTESLHPQLRGFNICISAIQPGVVNTKFGDNMLSNENPEEQVGKVDEDTMKQLLRFQMTLGKTFESEVQQPEPVVDIIVECIKAEKPKLRYPTSDKVRERFRERFVDELGAGGTEYWYKTLSE